MTWSTCLKAYSTFPCSIFFSEDRKELCSRACCSGRWNRNKIIFFLSWWAICLYLNFTLGQSLHTKTGGCHGAESSETDLDVFVDYSDSLLIASEESRGEYKGMLNVAPLSDSWLSLWGGLTTKGSTLGQGEFMAEQRGVKKRAGKTWNVPGWPRMDDLNWILSHFKSMVLQKWGARVRMRQCWLGWGFLVKKQWMWQR